MYYVCMKITCDPRKNRINIKKHGIDLLSVEPVFNDIFAITVEDVDSNEERFVTIGMNAEFRLLVVTYHYRADDIRVISARPADRSEQRIYREGE